MSHSLIEKIIYTVLRNVHHNRCFHRCCNTCENNFFKRPSSFLQYRNSLTAQYICILPFRQLSVSCNKCTGPAPVPVIWSEETWFSANLQDLYFVHNHYNVFTLQAWTLHFCAFHNDLPYPWTWGHLSAKSGSTHPLTQMVDGWLGSQLRGYHPVTPRSIAAGPLCTAHHLQRHSTSSNMRDLC
jgi:hypothetical protein